MPRTSAAYDRPVMESAHTFTTLMNLIDRRLGAEVIAVSDEFFAACSNLLEPTEAVWDADRFTDDGKWMDGWESRRRRIPGHDWCVLKLGAPGVIAGVDIDCAYFVGNCPEAAWIEGCWAPDASVDQLTSDTPEHRTLGAPSEGDVRWHPLTEMVTIEPGGHNIVQCTSSEPVTHVRMHILPDGGVARLRLFGSVLCDWPTLCSTADEVNLAAAELGARAVFANDSFFGHHDNLLVPTPPRNMGEGWETRRRRGPAGEDYVVVRLAGPGRLTRCVVDTMFFKGNYPATVALDAANVDVEPDDWASPEVSWETVCGQQPLGPHAPHEFALDHQTATHVRMRIAPDGGVARLRVYGVPLPVAPDPGSIQ